jgi:hypothetical protein
MAKSVQITFKETEKELYEWFMKKRNRSCFVKDLLQETKEKEKKKKEPFLKLE